jgi:subtilisin family serine protease
MLAASLVSPFSGQVQAQGDEPPRPTRERVQLNQVDLSEVETHYGRLADQKGNIGVVVEFKTEPAALVYARSQGLLQGEMTSLTQNQIAQIEEEQESFLRALDRQNIQAQELFRTQKVFNGIWLRLDAKDVAKLRTLPGVKAIHPIIPKTLDHTTSVPLIGAPQLWGGLTNYQGEDIKIGVIDTGIDYIHTNFGGPGSGYATQDFTSITEVGNLFPTLKGRMRL